VYLNISLEIIEPVHRTVGNVSIQFAVQRHNARNSVQLMHWLRSSSLDLFADHPLSGLRSMTGSERNLPLPSELKLLPESASRS
jgi:hypothetical protein